MPTLRFWRHIDGSQLRRALQKYIEDPLSEAIIQGMLPRPAEFDVYLGDTDTFCPHIVEQRY